jgi:hypothetical protein
MIAGLLLPARGEIVLQGGIEDLALPEQAHYLGHRDALKPSLSVRENLRFWAAYLGGDAGQGRRRPAGCRPAGYLSAGQRRRLSIARLLAAPRPIWLLDEPTAALAAAAQVRLAELMRSHLAGGRAHPRRHACSPRARRRPGTQDGRRRMNGVFLHLSPAGRGRGAAQAARRVRGWPFTRPVPLTRISRFARNPTSSRRGEVKTSASHELPGALLLRDMRISVRIGGGATMGVLLNETRDHARPMGTEGGRSHRGAGREALTGSRRSRRGSQRGMTRAGASTASKDRAVK